MVHFAITHPVALIARGIENVVIYGKNNKNWFLQGGSAVLSRTVSLTVFPAFLLLEIAFKRIPKLILAIGDQDRFDRKGDKLLKFILAFSFFPLGIYAPEGVSGFFLKSSFSNSVRPFGVEQQYGKQVNEIIYPENVDELRRVVLRAIREKKQISLVGAGMSQGIQTVPSDDQHIVVNIRKLNHVEVVDDETISVQAGATWEILQTILNSSGKSVLVKQASDLFSIGGSSGINCHGWGYEGRAVAATIKLLDFIDATGELQTVIPRDELFGCMFGTFGYFGVVVRVSLKITDDEILVQRGEEIPSRETVTYYKTKIKGQDIPLFGGRLSINQVDGDPLQTVCMVHYEKIGEEQPTNIKLFLPEPKQGTRIERIALKLLSTLSYFQSRGLVKLYWERERANMLKVDYLTRNAVLHPPMNAFKMLHHSNLHAQWVQEYFIKEENLPNFLEFLGRILKENHVRLLNATVKPTPKDDISILPYANQDRFAVVICFAQEKTEQEIAKTKRWIEKVTERLVAQNDVYYQAYMPFATREQFEACYGKERVAELRRLKEKYDPGHVFGNAHTAKYFDESRKDL